MKVELRATAIIRSQKNGILYSKMININPNILVLIANSAQILHRIISNEKKIDIFIACYNL